MTTALEQDRETLQTLARTSSRLVVPERRALHSAQSLLRRIDRALELHAPDAQGQCAEDGHDWPCPTITRLGVTQ